MQRTKVILVTVPPVMAMAAMLMVLAAVSQSAEEPASPPAATTPIPGAKQERAPEEEPDDFEPPSPTAASERTEERQRMVKRHIARDRFGSSPVTDEAVLEAMRTVPRHVFVPKAQRRRAYADTPLPIGHGQTISQPYMVAFMTELLGVTPESNVLEIGTGSGYQAAVLGQLTPHVYTMEIIEPLAGRAAAVLREQGYAEIHCRQADGYHGWPEAAPFDAIIVTCAAGHLPPPLWEQLKPGGRIVIPIGGPYETQRLTVATKQDDGSRKTRSVMAVRFVPLTRKGDL